LKNREIKVSFGREVFLNTSLNSRNNTEIILIALEVPFFNRSVAWIGCNECFLLRHYPDVRNTDLYILSGILKTIYALSF
jgi:hypothetical protein